MEGESKVGGKSHKKALKTEVFRAKPTYKPIFFHPDYTVGTGVSPVQSSFDWINAKEESRAFTAGGDLLHEEEPLRSSSMVAHPALKIYRYSIGFMSLCQGLHSCMDLPGALLPIGRPTAYQSFCCQGLQWEESGFGRGKRTEAVSPWGCAG